MGFSLPALPAAPFRLVLLDAHPLVRAGIRRTLEAMDGGQIVGEGSTTEEALQRLSGESCDVLVLDPEHADCDLIENCRQRWPDLAFLIHTGANTVGDIVQALREGASACVMKSSPPDLLVIALQHLRRGKAFLDLTVVPLLLQHLCALQP